MNWKKYDDLTDEQKVSVSKMYATGEPKDYMYDFDDNGNFHGRTLVVEVEEEKSFVEKVQDEIEEVIDNVKAKSKRNKKK
jgi:hypothetical protein